MRRMPFGVRKFAWWWDRLYRQIGGGGFSQDDAIDSRWPAGEHGPVRNRRFGFRSWCDLRNFAERRVFFSGRCPQTELEYLFPAILRPGDQYVDIGSNIGLVAMMGSTIIGTGGSGFGFEPNPEVFTRLKRHFELNRVTNLVPVPFALADRESEATLVVPGHVVGCGSLAFDASDAGDRIAVRTVTGRSYVEQLDPAKPTVIKIDAEGYEVKALSGIEEFLERPELAIVAEVNTPLLRRAGDSPEALFDLMHRHSFRPFTFDLRHGRFRTRLEIRDALHAPIPEEWRDFLFAKPDSKIYRERIAPSLSR